MGLWEWIKGEEPGLLDQWLHSDDTGHFGEYLIDYALNSVPGYSKKLCNIYLPYKNRTSEIDVVMLHETGIYVFESKNYSGWIFGDEKSQYWTQCLTPKEKNRFYNPILQNKTHIIALRQYLELPTEENMISYIVFSQRCELKKVCKRSENAIIVQRPQMLKSLRQEIAKRPTVFTQKQIDLMYEDLLGLTTVTAAEKAQHIQHIQEHKTPHKSQQKTPPPPAVKEPEPKTTAILCPKCGAPMILRTASKGKNQGSKFYGCSQYPKCKSIINIQ